MNLSRDVIWVGLQSSTASRSKLTFIRTLLDTDFDRTFHEPNPLRLVRLMKSAKFGVGLTG